MRSKKYVLLLSPTKMKFKYKIPPFVFGVSIGLLVGVAFFMFKIDDYIKKINKPTIDNIKIVEEKAPEEPTNKEKPEKMCIRDRLFL